MNVRPRPLKYDGIWSGVKVIPQHPVQQHRAPSPPGFAAATARRQQPAPAAGHCRLLRRSRSPRQPSAHDAERPCRPPAHHPGCLASTRPRPIAGLVPARGCRRASRSSAAPCYCCGAGDLQRWRTALQTFCNRNWTYVGSGTCSLDHMQHFISLSDCCANKSTRQKQERERKKTLACVSVTRRLAPGDGRAAAAAAVQRARAPQHGRARAEALPRLRPVGGAVAGRPAGRRRRWPPLLAVPRR